jgi:hypothetical protein
VVVTGRLNQPGCLSAEQQAEAVDAINAALGTRGRARLREPDPVLLAGSASGYRAGVQRHADDLFEDRSITKDVSPAVPGLEILFYQGDGDARWGTGRQVVQLAAAQASASYGIACLHGQRADGRCAAPGEQAVPGDPPQFGGGASGSRAGSDPSPPSVTTVTETVPGESALPLPGAGRETLLTRVLRAPLRALAQALSMLFNNPRELALLAAVWLLLYAPFHLGERQRTLRRVRLR